MIPVSQAIAVARHVLGHKLRGNPRYPLVLMIEPLFRCNLACAGCGKIQYPAHVLRRHLSVDAIAGAVEECPTPVVTLAGGEPLLHPEIREIVEMLVARGKFVYLCTNALVLHEKLDLFRASPQLSFSVHLDGLEHDHDRAVCREGTYETAVAAVREATRRGFRVTTNSTFFDGDAPERTAQFFDAMTELGVEGMMVSPGYSYEAAPDQDHFLRREKSRSFFRALLERGGRRWTFNQSPLFLEFLAGAREYDCTPWGNPTYTIFGWQRPCYLQQEGYAASFAELLELTPWSEYGHASGNPKCRDCMVHSGFEASAVDEAFSSVRGMAAMLRALLLGPRLKQPAAPAAPPPVPVVRPPAVGAELQSALDYRGEVTLTLKDGGVVRGYVSRADADRVDVWSAGQEEPSRLSPATIESVEAVG